jgi:membrane protein
MRKITFKPKTKLQSNLPGIPASLQSVINKPREAYARQRYNTPLFVLHEMLEAFQRHNALRAISLTFFLCDVCADTAGVVNVFFIEPFSV